MSFQLKPATINAAVAKSLIKRTVAIAETAKYTLVAATLNEDGTEATPAVMTNQAFFVEGDVTIIPAHKDEQGNDVPERTVANPTPVASIKDALSIGVTGTRFAFADADVDLKANHRSNWLLRSRQNAFGTRAAVQGAGLSFIIEQTVDGQDYATLVRLDQAPGVLSGQRVLVRGQVPIIAVRTREEIVTDEDGPVLVDGKPQMRTVELKPSDVFTSVPTWEQLADLPLVSLRDNEGRSQQYHVQDVLAWDCANRIEQYALNHNGESLQKTPMDCLAWTVSTNHYYKAEAQAIRDEGGEITGERGPGDIRHNSGDWHLGKAGLTFGVIGPRSRAYIGFISASDLCKSICGTGIKPHFVPRRAVQGQEYRNNRTSGASLVPAGNLVAKDGEKAF